MLEGADGQPHVMTVLGAIAPDEAGVVLPHEHLLVDLTCYWRAPREADQLAFAESPVTLESGWRLRRQPMLSRDNCLLLDVETAVAELAAFRTLGGSTVVDVTLSDIGRDVMALREMSRRSGLHVVAGCGHYVHLAHPPELAAEPAESIAERLVVELSEGIDGTGARAGIIGEIGTSDPLHPVEERVLRAAACAQARTGAAITLHLSPGHRNEHQVLDILEEEGADLGRVVAGHLDIALADLGRTPDESVRAQLAIARRGCFVEYDTCGNDTYSGGEDPFWFPSDRERVIALTKLAEAGFLDRLLLSHDVCHKSDLTAYGGLGYGHLLRTFQINLREVGFIDRELTAMMRDNPRRMLTIG
jgi:phosphotriesterase-related protein